MALKLKYTDEHGILHINMSPTSSPTVGPESRPDCVSESDKTDINDPQFDTINNRFAQYDLFGGKYENYQEKSGDVETQSLFRSRYNSIEEELANTPYAFATERTLRFNAHSPLLDITIERGTDVSPSKDIEDDRFFNRPIDSLFGPSIDLQKSSDEERDLLETPAFTVTQLIHAQDRYFDLSSRQSTQISSDTKSEVKSASEVRTVVSGVKRAGVSAVNPRATEPKSGELKSRATEAKTRVTDVKPRVTEAKPRVTEVKPRVSAKQRVTEAKSRVAEAKQGVHEARLGVKEKEDEAFRVLSAQISVKSVHSTLSSVDSPPEETVVPISVRKKEKSFVIIPEAPSSRPDSPKSLPIEIRSGRVSPFRGRGFREETSRHTTPRTSAANSRANTPPPRRRTSSLTRLDSMAAATLPPPLPPIQITLPHTPRDFVKENIEEVRELSELNREKNEAEAEKKRLEEEEALLKEMGLLDQNAKSDAIRSVVCSRTTSRSNSPNKIRLRSRSNSPSAPSILKFENLQPEKKMIINKNDGMDLPVTHRSRVRSVSKSQPQSNDGSPKHSKIPKRQSSVSPNRKREPISRRPVENGLRNQRFISNSTSSIHETIKIGGQAHDRRGMSKSTQFLNISPAHIRGKPPISPTGRGGPPPSNRAINSKRLSPIVGTPNKSPTEDKPNSARTPTKTSSVARKPVKTAGNTPATSRFNSRQPSRNVSRDPSPEKRRTTTKPSTVKPPAVNKFRPVARAVSTRNTQKPTVNKTEPKKPVSRTNSMKSLTKTSSMTKNLAEKPPAPLKKRDSQKSLKGSTNKLNTSAAFNKPETAKDKSPAKSAKKETVIEKSKEKPENDKDDGKKCKESSTDDSPLMAINTTDSETQYDKITNEKGDLVILTKKNIVSMTTAAITSQPLEVVTKVTNQLPATLEKAREKGIFERHSSRDSLGPKDEDAKDSTKKDDKHEHKGTAKTVFEESVKLKPLLPPYNNPQVERVKQRIDDILKTPEVSTENIATAASKSKEKEKSTFKSFADKTKNDIKEAKEETTKKFTDIKDEAKKQSAKAAAELATAEKTSVEAVKAEASKVEKAIENTTADIRNEASKIVDSIMTPIEEPKPTKPKEEVKKDIEPIITVVNEKINGPIRRNEIVERMQETLVKGEPEVEVQSSNLSTSGDEMAARSNMPDESGSAQSNGGFPQSTSTTPKPPARVKKGSKDLKSDLKDLKDDLGKPQNFCQRLMGKCKKSCACCVKGEKEMQDKKDTVEGKRGMMSRLNCCKKTEKADRDAEMAAGKAASIEFESETKRKRSFRDVMCGCCARGRRVSDASEHVAGEAGCCGRRQQVERRDSILSDRPPNSCCNNRLFTWMRGSCRRQQPEPLSASRRQSLFSKNKSMSPTLPPETVFTPKDKSRRLCPFHFKIRHAAAKYSILTYLLGKIYANYRDYKEEIRAMDNRYCPDIPCRWNSYGSYRLVLLMFLMNEMSVSFAVAEIAHSAFFLHAAIHVLAVVFIGIPLIYSEISIAQYTNCSLISLWNFFPLFRGFGYGMFFSMFLRTLYLNCLASWYLVYTFYATFNRPPWISCEYFGEKFINRCMVKKINITIFQYCLEKSESGYDMPYFTASLFFFEQTIGDNNTLKYPKTCFFQWKALIAFVSINLVIFVLSIKTEKFIQISVKIAIFYVGTVLLLLVSAALFEEGSWKISRYDFQWYDADYSRYIDAVKKAFLTNGIGTGMLTYLSHDASFRSPATMTAVTSSLFSLTVCISFSLVLFSGIKCMVYHHGGEERVIEQGKSLLFTELGSASEILSYFAYQELWTFLWFSSIFFCLFLNIWICYNFISDLVFNNIKVARKYGNSSRFIINIIICGFAWPFLCADMFESLVQAALLIQLITTFFFSISLYWFYGYEKHSIDITFMIGVKSSIYWKVTWILNPFLVAIVIYHKLKSMECRNSSYIFHKNGVEIEDMTAYWIMLYGIIALYVFIVIVSTVFELMTYRHYNFRELFVASPRWGPKDVVLYKSRKMFVPSIMTTEFLYKQVRLKGNEFRRSHKRYSLSKTVLKQTPSEDSLSDTKTWSVLTSN